MVFIFLYSFIYYNSFTFFSFFYRSTHDSWYILFPFYETSQRDRATGFRASLWEPLKDRNCLIHPSRGLVHESVCFVWSASEGGDRTTPHPSDMIGQSGKELGSLTSGPKAKKG